VNFCPTRIIIALDNIGASIQKHQILNAITKLLNNQTGVLPLNFNTDLKVNVNPAFAFQGQE